jgi:RHS repeat-associated protein
VLDATNSVVAAYDYLTFGTVARKVEPSAGFMPYLFTGQEWDAEIGLYNYRARFYSSELGRFLDVDPARQFFSPYIYAANNPVLYVDPTGTFSLKSLFSAIAGVIIGAVEILIGVVVDVIAGVLEVVTGGLSTPASVALAALAGTFYGAGASAILYSVVNVGSFDWKEYGIQMGIGAVAGALSFGIGAFGSAVAEGATGVKAAVEAGQEVSRLAKFANAAIDTGFTATGGFVSGVASAGIGDAAHNTNPGFDLVEGGLWSALSFGLGKAIPGPSYKAGWGNLGKRVLINVGKKEAIGVSVNTTRNAVEGNPLDQGLLNTVASGALWGTLGSLQAQAATKEALDFKLDLSGISFE